MDYLAAKNRPYRRSYEGTNTDYLAGDFLRHRKKVKGKVVAVDAARDSLVIKPPLIKGGLFNRYWAKIVSQEGEPLVGFTILD